MNSKYPKSEGCGCHYLVATESPHVLLEVTCPWWAQEHLHRGNPRSWHTAPSSHLLLDFFHTDSWTHGVKQPQTACSCPLLTECVVSPVHRLWGLLFTPGSHRGASWSSPFHSGWITPSCLLLTGVCRGSLQQSQQLHRPFPGHRAPSPVLPV